MFPIIKREQSRKERALNKGKFNTSEITIAVGCCQDWFFMEDRDHKDMALENKGLNEMSAVELPKGMHTCGCEWHSYNPY